jgi:hypothetical protein
MALGQIHIVSLRQFRNPDFGLGIGQMQAVAPVFLSGGHSFL